MAKTKYAFKQNMLLLNSWIFL